jgi:hypothetical protein
MATHATAQVKPAPLGNAALVLGDKRCGIIRRLSGGSVGASVVEHPIPGSREMKKLIGLPRHEDFSLDLGFAMTSPVFEWIAATWEMKAPYRDGAILACDVELKPKSQRKFTGAVITETTIPALDATGKSPVWLNLKFAVQTLHLEAASGDKVSGDPHHPEKLLMPASFRLEIDKLDCKKVRAIDSFTVKQTLHRTHGQPELTPGGVEFPNLKITFSEVAVDSWQGWLEDFVIKGNDKEKSGTLTLLSPDQKQTLAVIKLHGLGIFNLSHAAVGNAVDEHHMLATAELYCQRMEFQPGT